MLLPNTAMSISASSTPGKAIWVSMSFMINLVDLPAVIPGNSPHGAAHNQAKHHGERPHQKGHPGALHNAAEHIPAKLIRPQGMGGGKELQLVLRVHHVRVIGHIEKAHHHQQHHQPHHAQADDEILVVQTLF